MPWAKRLEEIPPLRFWTAAALLALLSRLVFLVYWEKGGFTSLYGYDPYVTFAQSWLGWLPPMQDISHPPIYTLWVCFIFRILGQPSFLAVQAVNALLSSLVCLLLGLWAEKAVSKTVGRLTALCAALDPQLIFFSVQLQSEPTFLALEMTFFLWLLRLARDPSLAEAAGLGLLGGILTLTRSVFAGFPPFLCGALLLRDFSAKSRLVCLGIVLGWSLPIAAWSLRNWEKYHAFVPLTNNAGWTLYEGFTLDREEIRRRPEQMRKEVERLGIDKSSDPNAVDRYFKKKTLTYIQEYPLKAGKIITGKLLRFWRPWPYDPHSRPIRLLLSFYFSVLFLLALLGAWSTRSHWRRLAPVYALFLCLSLIHSFFFTSLRYRTPLEPFLCFFAAAGFLDALSRLTEAPHESKPDEA